MIAVGLMSGTSLDGIDAALVQILPDGLSYAISLRKFATFPIDPALLRGLRAALAPSVVPVAALANLHVELGRAFARAAASVADGSAVDYVASHGQTVFHDGDHSVTLQIGDPFSIRERLQATVIYDFRSADCAAGGHGAPLIPYVDALFFGSPDEDRVALNLGGIANVTILPRGSVLERVTAFDTGPGNMLIDAFVTERTGGGERYDPAGRYAAAGTVDHELLAALLADPYFARKLPKSTGREWFGAPFFQRFGGSLRELSIEDGAATLTALTARTVADAIGAFAAPQGRLIISGGGVHNATLIAMLRGQLGGYLIERSDVYGVNADAKEALAFAVLGYEALRARPASLPRVTGAGSPRILGAVAPLRLVELLAKMEVELAR